MHNITKTSAFFTVYSFSYSIGELESFIGMPNINAKPCKGSNRRNIKAIWSLHSELDNKTSSLELHFSHLLDKLEPYSEKFKNLSLQNNELFFSGTIFSLDGRPAITFEQSTLNGISNLGADLSIALYIDPESRLFNWDAEERQ